VTHKIGVVVVNHRSTGTRPAVALAGSIVRSDLRLTNPPERTCQDRVRCVKRTMEQGSAPATERSASLHAPYATVR
jgi:hypothetical protein